MNCVAGSHVGALERDVGDAVDLVRRRDLDVQLGHARDRHVALDHRARVGGVLRLHAVDVDPRAQGEVAACGRRPSAHSSPPYASRRQRHGSPPRRAARGPGDHVRGEQLADARGALGAGVAGGADGADVAAHDDRAHRGSTRWMPHELDVRGLDHRIRRLDAPPRSRASRPCPSACRRQRIAHHRSIACRTSSSRLAPTAAAGAGCAGRRRAGADGVGGGPAGAGGARAGDRLAVERPRRDAQVVGAARGHLPARGSARATRFRLIRCRDADVVGRDRPADRAGADHERAVDAGRVPHRAEQRRRVDEHAVGRARPRRSAR